MSAPTTPTTTQTGETDMTTMTKTPTTATEDAPIITAYTGGTPHMPDVRLYDLSREVWRVVEGYAPDVDGVLEVSHLGRVRRVSDGAMVKPYVGGSGTLYARVRVGRRYVYVHRLVAHAHLGRLPGGLEIDHINGNALDNRVLNLRHVTPQENARATRLRATIGETHPLRDLVTDCRTRYPAGPSGSRQRIYRRNARIWERIRHEYLDLMTRE